MIEGFWVESSYSVWSLGTPSTWRWGKLAFRLFQRLCKTGVIQNVFKSLPYKLPKRCIAMIGTSYIKAQRTASSLRADALSRALGRSKGGITTKIHLLCDEQRRPKDFKITAGQVAYIEIAPELVKGNKMTCHLADRAYDADAFRNELERRHIRACIPSKSNRKKTITHDPVLYSRRHVIKNMFSRLKDWNGINFCSNFCSHTFYAFVSVALIVLFFIRAARSQIYKKDNLYII